MELKDLLETLDMSDIKDVEAFKEKFNEKFIARSQALEDEEITGKIKSKIIGLTSGSIVTLAKREFGLTSEEVKDKKYEEVLELAAQKTKEKMQELEGKAGQSNDEALKTLQTKLDKLKLEREEYKGLLDSTKTEYETFKADSEAKFKNLKISTAFGKLKETVAPKLSENMSEADRFYFENKIKESFKFDFDEKDTLQVLDSEGKRIQNPKKIGTFLTPEEAVEMKAAELKYLKQNPGGKPAPAQQQQQQQVQPQGVERRIHPNALKNAEALRSQP